MPVLKVKNRLTGEFVEAKVDTDSLKKVSQYQYFIDKFSRKPYRDVKDGNQIRRYFLDRDILGCKLKDGRMIKHKNEDPLDNRLENLIEKQRKMISSSGYRWPHTVDSLVNFLSKKEGDEEDLCSEFLAKADIQRFTRKRVDVLAHPDEYDAYKKKGIDRVIKGVLHKYFDWSGVLNITKEIKPTDIAPAAPIPATVVRDNVNVTEVRYEFEEGGGFSVPHIKKQLNQLIAFGDDDTLLEILRDRRICPTEIIIKVLQERGASSVNFSTSK
jgi:hypothetical protein